MQFVKLACSYYLDPAVLTLSETAEIAFVRSLAYAGGAESSGFIPEAALPMLMRSWTPARGRKVAGELVTAQLWVEVPGGWLLRSWHKHQDRMESGIVERRRKDAERQRKHRAEQAEGEQPPAMSRDMSRDEERDMSREKSRDPSRANAGTRAGDVEVDLEEEPNPLLTDLARRLSRNARETTTTRELAYWSKLAGSADLDLEIEAFLVKNMGCVLDDPPGAWHGWLRAAAKRASDDQARPRPPTCSRCHSTGWDGEDADGRPRRCACRTVTPITSAPSAGVA